MYRYQSDHDTSQRILTNGKLSRRPVLRLFAIFGILVTGFFPGVLAYIIAIFLVPEEPVRKQA